MQKLPAWHEITVRYFNGAGYVVSRIDFPVTGLRPVAATVHQVGIRQGLGRTWPESGFRHDVYEHFHN